MLSPPYHIREQLNYLPIITPLKESVKLNESQPITYFFHAVLHYGNCIKLFKRKPTCKEYRDRYSKAQKVLLNTLFTVYSEMHDSKKSNRDYLRVLGPRTKFDVQNTFHHITFQYCFGIFFGILAENKYSILEEKAKLLYHSFEKTLNLIIARCVKCTLYPYDDLFPVLEEFDRLWTEFESRLVALLVNPPSLGMIQLVSNEVFTRSYWNHSISSDMIQNKLSIIVVALPRLIVLAGLTEFSQIFDISNPEYELNWYKEYSSLLKELKKLLERMNEIKITVLKMCLIHSNIALNTEDCQDIKVCYVAIAKIADRVAVDRRKIMAEILDISLSLRQ